jgi:K(+)-stimulated pyrophosphate-energized sodium pump
VGDTVGDPFKDTSSVAMNPVIKFTTLFGLLAVELALQVDATVKAFAFVVLLLAALVFVRRSFYGMRIKVGAAAVAERAAPAAMSARG